MSSTLLQAGIDALKNGDARGAIQHLVLALVQNPEDAQAHTYLGMAYGQTGVYDRAVDHLRRAVQFAPQTPAIRFNLAIALEQAGQAAEAVATYQNVLALDPNHARAAQALARLGAPAVPRPIAPPPGAMPAAAAPPPPLHAAPGSLAGPPGTPDPTAPLPQAGGPAGMSIPPQGGPPGAAPPPQPYGGPPASGPPAGRQPLGEWTPRQHTSEYGGGAPTGMQALGDWTPPRPSGEPTQSWSSGQNAAGSGPAPPPRITGPGSNVYIAENPERNLSQSEQAGHGYLAGMVQGAWWGLIGAFFVFMWFLLVINASDMGRFMPIAVVLGLMYVALGALLYGFIGLAGANAESAEELCSNLGTGIGVVEALVTMYITQHFLVYLGLPQIVGCVWVSRALGKGLGGKIDEWRTTVTVVAGPRGVAATAVRPH